MPNPLAFDHVVFVLLVAVLPFVAARNYRRLVRRVAAGVPDARVREYRRTTVIQWTVMLAILAAWLLVGRTLEVLGFAVPGGLRLAVGAGVTVLGLAFLSWQWRVASGMDEQTRVKLRKQMESVAPLIPRSTEEAAWFRILSLTAGTCEEIVYRGYLVWYLAASLGPWPAALVAGALFGVLHLYQGPAGIVRTGAIGIAMAVLYVGTGSLLWPMILHGAIDLNGGAVGRRVLRNEPRGQPVPARDRAAFM